MNYIFNLVAKCHHKEIQLELHKFSRKIIDYVCLLDPFMDGDLYTIVIIPVLHLRPPEHLFSLNISSQKQFGLLNVVFADLRIYLCLRLIL